MKVVVPVKRVIDFAVKIRIRNDKSGVETQNVKMSINPFCEIAVEAGLKLKEIGIAKEIIAVAVGPPACQQTLLHALGMGADRGIHVLTTQSDTAPQPLIEPLTVAKILKKLVEKESPQLVILGKQAIDDDANQTGQMLAGLLNWPQGTFVSKIEKDKDSNSLVITREIDSGLQNLCLPLPAILTCDLRLNEPRFITLQNVLKAKKKPIDKTTPEELQVDTKPHSQILSVEEPPTRTAGKKVETAQELVDQLKKIGAI